MKANVCVFSHVTRAKQVTNEASQCCVGGLAMMCKSLVAILSFDYDEGKRTKHSIPK
jgi:hypothetical protein